MEQSLTTKTFEKVSARMQELGLDQAKVKKEVSFALQAINKSELLQKCTIESKQEAVLNVANVGLSLDPNQKLAYLIARWNRNINGYECHLMPDYRGLVKVLTDTGSVQAVSAHIVFEKDDYQVNKGDFINPIIHKYNSFKDRGDAVGVYALAVLNNGLKQMEDMSIEAINEIRERSDAYQAFIAKKTTSCIWESDYYEMAKKTAIRRLTKYLPKSEQNDRVSRVIQLDSAEYMPSEGSREYARDLLRTSTFTERLEIYAIENAIDSGNIQQLNETIEMLKQNQFDNGIKSMGDIHEQLKKQGL